MTPQLRSELETLTSGLCEGQLGDADFARLETLLQQDAECRRFYLQYVDLHARLMQHPGLTVHLDEVTSTNLTKASGAISAAPAPSTQTHSTAWRAYALTALATLTASLLLQFVLRRPIPEVSLPEVSLPEVSLTAAEVRPATLSYVATLSKACHCEWEDAERRTAMRLTPGDLRLKSGRAVVHFDAGAELVLEGPAVVQIESATAATLRQGKVLFRDDNSTEPFDLRTPNSRLVDLGTEYAVSVGPTGDEVHVFDGEVIRTPSAVADDRQATVSVVAGEARRFASAKDAEGSPVPLDADAFRLAPMTAMPAVADPNAGLIAVESFDYDALRLPSPGAVNLGRGWASPWMTPAKFSPTADFRMTAGLWRMSKPTAALGFGIAASRRASIIRRLSKPVAMDRDGVYYLSMLVRAESSKRVAPCDMQIVLRTEDSTDPRSRLAATISWSGSSLSLGWAGSGATASLPLSTGRTYLLVGKLAADDREPDQAFLRLFGNKDPLPVEEPSSWTVAGRPISSDCRFDAVQITVNTAAPVMIDEIRLGTTWEAVVAVAATSAAASQPGTTKPRTASIPTP